MKISLDKGDVLTLRPQHVEPGEKIKLLIMGGHGTGAKEHCSEKYKLTGKVINHSLADETFTIFDDVYDLGEVTSLFPSLKEEGKVFFGGAHPLADRLAEHNAQIIIHVEASKGNNGPVIELWENNCMVASSNSFNEIVRYYSHTAGVSN